jgi:outer membrane lipoprotein-sorting protein
LNTRNTSLGACTLLVLTLSLSPAFSQRVPGDPSGDEILAKVDENNTSDSRISTSSMTVHERRESRTMEMKSWGEGTDKAFTEFLSPPRDRGTKMLKLHDQLWTYTPSTDRIIMISGHMLRQPVMGSDLSYEDLLEDQRLRSMYDAKVTGEEEVKGRPCWTLDLVARSSDVAYPSRKIWVDKDRFVVMREDRFARSGKLLKTAELQEVKRIGHRWVGMLMTFKDALKEGEGTEFRIKTIEFDTPIPPSTFSKAALRR